MATMSTTSASGAWDPEAPIQRAPRPGDERELARASVCEGMILQIPLAIEVSANADKDTPIEPPKTMQVQIVNPRPEHLGELRIAVTDGETTLYITICSRARLSMPTDSTLAVLAKHAFRLQKNLTFFGIEDISAITESDLRDDTIHLIPNYTESGGSLSTSRRMDIGSESINFNSLETETGVMVRMQCPPKSTEGMGYTIKDSKNLAIAYMSKQLGALMLLWSGVSNSDVPSKYIALYFDYILSFYNSDFDKMKEEARTFIKQLREERKHREYLEFLDNMFSVTIENTHKAIDKLRRDVDSHMRGLLKQGQELEKERKFLNATENRMDNKELRDQLEKDYTLLQNMEKANKYTQFRFSEQCIIGVTSPILLFGKYDIGHFEVKLYLDGRIKCINLKGAVGSHNDYDHPHVSTGNPCWGNLDQSVLSFMRQQQYGLVFDTMYQFLCHYNDGHGRGAHHAPYISLQDGWPHLTEQGLSICRRCHRIRELCSCRTVTRTVAGSEAATCHVCSETLDNCGCDRCPAENPPNNVLGEDVSCDECEYLDEDGECSHRDR